MTRIVDASLATAITILFLYSGQSLSAQKLLSESVKDLANQIDANASKEQKKKVAVVPFRELDGQATVLGVFLAEDLVTNLFALGNLDIVERAMLDRVMAELKLGTSGAIDPDTAKQLGKVAGVDAIVTGSITDLQSYVAVNCRMIDAQTGRIFAAAQARIVKDDDLRKIMGMPLAPSPSDRRVVASGSSSSETPSSTLTRPAAASAPKLPTAMAMQITVQVQLCRRAGQEVICELLITNSGSDASLGLMTNKMYAEHTRAFDEHGAEYPSSRISLGADTSTNYKAHIQLVSGVPAKGEIAFDAVTSTSRTFTLIELNGELLRQNLGLGGFFKLQLRNVNISE